MQFFKYIFRQLKTRLDITPEKVDEATVIDNVRHAVMFRGVNLWILIFAVIIASVGLNIDSTPIIIGAMLISPLMGPIIGTGLAVGINDMELMKRSIRNLFVAALFAVFAAMIYFFISPLNEAQSELLARTSPTLYDVLIAFVGGIAGFLSLSTQGNHIQVIIGVAISTALLPPLCTVGFGLATGQWLYALGAFYLFFINSVFIAIATFLSARLMRFSQKEFADKEHERKVRRMLIGLSLLALLPSFYLTYRIVGNTLYEENASDFVVSELNFPGTQLVSKQIEPRQRTIIAIIAGKYIPQQFIEQAKEKLPQYHLAGTRLLVMQGAGRDSTMLSSIRGDIMKELYQKDETYVNILQTRIDSLQLSLSDALRYERMDTLLYSETRILFPQVKNLALGKLWSVGDKDITSYPFIRIMHSVYMSDEEKETLSTWLRMRVGEPNAQFEFYEPE